MWAPFNQLSSFVQFQTQLPNRSYHKIKSSLKITFSNCLQLKEDNFYLLPKNPPYKNVLFNQRSKLSQHFHFYHEFIFWVFLNFPKSHMLYKRKIGNKGYTHKTKSNPIRSNQWGKETLLGFISQNKPDNGLWKKHKRAKETQDSGDPVYANEHTTSRVIKNIHLQLPKRN